MTTDDGLRERLEKWARSEQDMSRHSLNHGWPEVSQLHLRRADDLRRCLALVEDAIARKNALQARTIGDGGSSP